MALRSLRPCTVPGCRALVRGSPRCDVHETAYRRQKEATRAPRLEPGFYASKDWRRLRAIVLREEPVCPCGNPTNTVDHVLDRRQRPDLALVRSNLRGLCKRCHDSRTARDHLNRTR